MKIDIAVGLAIFLCLVLGIVIVGTIRENRQMLFSRSGKPKVVKCEICAYVFFVTMKVAYVRCPVCSSLNKIV